MSKTKPGFWVDNDGFTIIEVVLFLALSAILVLAALANLRGRADAVRYTQSVRSLESFLQFQQNLVRTGAIPLQSIDASRSCAGECLYLGRIVEFTPDSSRYRIYTVFGDRVDNLTNKETTTLLEAEPRVARDSLGNVVYEEGDLEWQLVFQTGIHGGTNTVSSNNRLIGYLRAPDSTDVIPIALSIASGDGNDVIDLPQNFNVDQNSNQATSIHSEFRYQACFKSINNQFAKLDLGEGSQKDAIAIELDEADGCEL